MEKKYDNWKAFHPSSKNISNMQTCPKKKTKIDDVDVKWKRNLYPI